jgi:hypothetical protein
LLERGRGDDKDFLGEPRFESREGAVGFIGHVRSVGPERGLDEGEDEFPVQADQNAGVPLGHVEGRRDRIFVGLQKVPGVARLDLVDEEGRGSRANMPEAFGARRRDALKDRMEDGELVDRQLWRFEQRLDHATRGRRF